MAQYLNFDLENVSGDNNYGMKLIAFPNRVKITNVIFTVNWEMWGTAEEDRTWLLYALASHPYDNEGSDYEWYWPIFGEASKPVVERSSNVRFRSDVAPTGVYSAPYQTPNIIREVHNGVVTEGDYIGFWVQCDTGDISGISWEDTRCSITVEYEETTKESAYEAQDWYAW